MEETKKVLKEISVYYGFQFKKDTKMSWYSHLKDFSGDAIACAWKEWRERNIFQAKPPAPWEIVRLIKESQPPKIYSGERISSYVPGTCFIYETVQRGVDNMLKNMPDLLMRLRECNSFAEKIILCAVASNNPDLLENPIVKMLEKKLNTL